MKRLRCHIHLFFACAILIAVVGAGLLNLPLTAQTTYGSIAGAVTDPSGATIAGAQVTLTNVGTSEKRTQQTGNDGLFLFVNLIPGSYSIEVEKPGFKRYSRPQIAVDVNQNVHVDASLQVGNVQETVEVTAETPLIQTETSSLGTVVDTREANELPLNGRNIFNLTTITPSVVPQGNTLGTVVGKNPFDFANYQIGGAFANEGAIYLDGEPLNTGYINLPLIVPTQDAVSEFKVQYNNLGPEWGKFAGGVININTKSGTNELHGELYEYLRNRVLNANEFFNKTAELDEGLPNKAPPFTQNQFGGTIGGAVIKNKTFFFGSYEGFRLRQGVPYTTTVPTAAERTGNFSAPGLPIIYDPLSVNPNCPATSTCARTPFAGNVIPSTRINPTSTYLLNLYPLPTNPNAVTDNFTTAASGGGNTDEYVARVDQNITDKQVLFGRYTDWKLLSLAQDPFGTGLCKDRCEEDTDSKTIALGYTYAATATTTFSLNASLGRFTYLRTPKNEDFDVTNEGFPADYNGVVPNIERTPLTPCLAITDPLVGCSQGQSAISDYDTTINFSPQATLVRGRHTFVFGGQLEYTYDNYLQTNTGGGLISFNGSWTQSLARNATGATGGIDIADFLLGYGLGAGAAFGNQTTGSLVVSQPVAGKETYRALYFADNWHATSKLTLNLGIRYELQGPWSERYNRLTYLNPGAVNSSVTGCSGVAGSPCPGDLFLVGTGVNKGDNNLPLIKTNFAPRLGFAYALDQKTVIRGGYGIFFIPNFVSFALNPYGDVLNSATSQFFASNNQGLYPASTLNASNCTLSAPGAANFTCATPGPFGPSLVVPPGRNPQPNVSAYGLQQVPLNSAPYTNYQSGYLNQWNLDIQRQLPGGFFADVAYAGSHGVHLPQYQTQIDQIPDSFINQAEQQYTAGQPVTIAQKAATYPFSVALPGSLGPGDLIQGQLDRPYPEYNGLQLNGYGCCGSSYNSLQATVTKRFGGGGTILAAYTWSKLMSNTDTLTSWLEGGTTGGTGSVQDWNNLKNEWSVSSQNVPNRFVLSYVLDLPFGRGKHWASGVSGFADKIISGWGIDGTTTIQTGFPLKISEANGTPLSALSLGTGTLRPNVIAGCAETNSGSDTSRLGGNFGPNTWFNTACFTAPPAYGFGSEPRVDGLIQMDGPANFDFAAFKRTTFGPNEKMGIEFRAEFFDLFNHPQFGPPNESAGSSQFGFVTNTVNVPRLIQFGLKFAF
ncbi:MAG TPA: TonB-dependent receptor [Bryobacteraceae bacterium]|nr:TonB-dependent receptor [Bryobacteraceae bacterium]